MDTFYFLLIASWIFVGCAGWYLTNRKVKAAFREYIDFYLEQNNFTLLKYRVLWFSSGKFIIPWYKAFGPMVPNGRSSGSMYLELIVADQYAVEKNITCRIKSEGFYIVDAEFKE